MAIVSFFNIDQLLPIYITGVGIEFDQKSIARSHGICDYQWLETISGSGILNINGNEYKINENTGFLIPKNVSHSYYPTTKNWTVNWVTFNGDMVLDYYKMLNLDQFLLSTENLTGFIKRAVSHIGQINVAVRNSALIIEMLCQLAQHGKKSVIEPAIQYINENYHLDITLNDLANIMGLSEQHFCKIFLKYAGVRPFEYVTIVRVGKSKEIMQANPTMTIEQVSNEVGYHSYQYFIKSFKKVEGISPGEYKKAIYFS